MLRLIRLGISLLSFTLFVWFAITVPLGRRTLWQHLRAISATKEAQELADGTREEAEKLAHKLKDQLSAADLGEPGRPATHPPQARDRTDPTPHLRRPLRPTPSP